MKIEVKGLSKPGYATAIYENGQMIPGITDVLISIRPDEFPTIITEQVVNETSKKYVIYYPGEFSMEA